MDFGSIQREASQYIGWVTVIVGAILAISRKARFYIQRVIKNDANSEQLAKSVADIKKDVESLVEAKTKSDRAVQSLLRNELTNIYYSGVDKKILIGHEKENVNKLNDSYKSLGGNSYVSELVDEMNSWEVIP